jgi:hypothetical protein
MALALPKRHMSVRELKERARAIEGGGARSGGGQRGLSRMAVSILRGWLFDHFLHPYPSDEEKDALAHATNLQKGQVRQLSFPGYTEIRWLRKAAAFFFFQEEAAGS